MARRTHRPILTEELARAAAWDAGNRSMREAGRTAWSRADYDAAVNELDRLLVTVDASRRARAHIRHVRPKATRYGW
jgi:hypothetical protein